MSGGCNISDFRCRQGVAAALRGILALLILLLTTAAPGHTATLRETVAGLVVLPVPYGITPLRVGGRPVTVFRLRERWYTAWGGDVYGFMVKDAGRWSIAEHAEPGQPDQAHFRTVPHTGEDVLSTLRVMVTRGEAPGPSLSALHVLWVERHTRCYVFELAPVTYTLLRLSQAPDAGGRFVLDVVDRLTPDSRYCNAEVAAHRELGIPFPDNGSEESWSGCETWEPQSCPPDD